MHGVPPKATDDDFPGRFREVISDPLNLLIERVPDAGQIRNNEVILHNGNRVSLSGAGSYYGPFSQLLIFNSGIHEPLEEYVFQEVLKELPDAPSMIELGAYWAHYSMWLKKIRPRSTTIMVEPIAENLAAGRANFARNGFEGEFIQSAVTTNQWEIDTFFRARNIGRLNILHADIQGYEGMLLDAGANVLGSALIDYIFLSTHSQDLHEYVVRGLTRHKYRIEVSSDFDHDTTAQDGFILAVSPSAKPVFKDFVHLGRTKIAEASASDKLAAIANARASRAACTG